MEAYLARGMDIDDFAPNFSFFFSNGMDPEYTVIGRVARRIWAVAMRDRYGANARSQKLKYHIQTSGRSLHAQEMAFNDIRTTLQALCAIYDNANSLHTNAYDEAVTTPTAESVRRALAIQMIINQEWGLARNENPLQGSFVVEELTDLVEEAVLAELERLSERGGVLGAMETGYQRGRIQDESMLYETKKHDGSLPIIGVNTFRNPAGDAVPDHLRAGPLDRGGEAEPAAPAGASSAPPTPASARPCWPGSRRPPWPARTCSRCSWTRCGPAAWARSPTPCSRSEAATGATCEPPAGGSLRNHDRISHISGRDRRPGATAMPTTYELSHLRTLEAEAVHIIREVAASFETPGPAVLGRQGLGRHAASGGQGLLAGRRCPSRSCTSTPGTTSTRSSSSGTGRWHGWGSAWWSPASRTTSTPAGWSRRPAPRPAATGCRP